MTAPRAILALVVTTVASVTVLSHHHRRPHPVALALVPPLPLTVRASRGEPRLPLLPVRTVPSSGAQGATRHHVRPSRPAGAAAHLLSVTAYCKTGSRTASGTWPQIGDAAVLNRSIPFGTRLQVDGNVVTVRDWVGHGADVDLFFGNDAGCEQRALTFGRKRLRVVEVAR